MWKENFKNIIVFPFALFFLFFLQKGFAQSSACPNVTASPDVSVCNTCTTLTATPQGSVETTSYSVSSVPYSPLAYNAGTAVLLGIDDTWSSVINLPFCFQFYGNTYSQIIIGSNGILSFDLSDAGGYCNWSLNSSNTLPTSVLPTNSIMGVYEDIDPTNMGGIYYQTVGTAPCRAFVVSFHQVPHYGDPNSVSPGDCSSAMSATYQIVLYETTNIIDVNIQDKQACTGWNDGLAILGIQNAAGSSAVTVTGRNNTVWTASNESHRFTPTGNPEYTITWYDGNNNAIGNTASVSVCPITTTTYTVELVNTTCSTPVTVTDQVTVTISSPCTSTPTCLFNAHGDTVCVGNIISLTADSVGSATYQWTGPNGFTANVRNPSITNAQTTHTGWYYVKDTIPSCSHKDSVYVLVNTGPTVNAGADQTVCGGDIALSGTLGGGASSATWSSSGSGTFSPNATSLNCTYTPSLADVSAGSITLTLTSASGGLCPAASDQLSVIFSSSATVDAGTASPVCVGTPVTLAGTMSGASSAAWSGGAGTFSPDNASLNVVYTPTASEYASGSVTLTLTASAGGGCPSTSDSVTLTFSQSPVVDFSGDTLLGCPGHCVDFTDLSTVSGSSVIDSWAWDFGDGSATVSEQNFSHCYTTSGNYSVSLTVISNNGCSASSVKNNYIQVFPEPSASFDPSPNPAEALAPDITMSNLSSSDVTHWIWNFGDGSSLDSTTYSPTHTYSGDTATSYAVTLLVSNAGGCVDSVQQVVSIGPGFTFYIPNSFTPNNEDEHNKFFFAYATGVTKFEMRIFDRWGNQVFHSTDLNEKWDGTVDKSKTISQTDVFVWKVSLTNVFKKSLDYVGTVTLMR